MAQFTVTAKTPQEMQRQLLIVAQNFAVLTVLAVGLLPDNQFHEDLQALAAWPQWLVDALARAHDWMYSPQNPRLYLWGTDVVDAARNEKVLRGAMLLPNDMVRDLDWDIKDAMLRSRRRRNASSRKSGRQA